MWSALIPKKNITGKGYTYNVSVVTENHGGFGETYNVTLRANETEIATRLVSVQVGAAVTINFTWNTSGYAYGGCIMSAYAWPVSGETITSNNSCTDGQVQVLMPGDIVSPFRKIDIRDVSFVTKRFGTNPSSPLWDPNADINDDGKVDIKDVSTVAKGFGTNY